MKIIVTYTSVLSVYIRVICGLFHLEVNMRSLVLILCIFFVAQAQPGRNMSTDQRVLAGTDWRLVSLGPAGGETNLVAGTTVTLKFSEDGRASGSTGCNSYSGTYQVRGDAISFGRMISTKRACLDQNANQQEQRFLSALELASRFRLSANRLTILSDRGRTVLNFVNDQSSQPENEAQDDRSDPIATLSSYYNAINSRDFRRAFRYWESPPSSYEQFERGFADTDRVRLLIEPPPRLEGAAGSSFAEIPTIIVATTRSGNERVFAGCYTLRKSNVRDMGWQIYRGEVLSVPSSARVSRLLAQSCRNSQ
jgi:heat shock protein HslJ